MTHLAETITAVAPFQWGGILAVMLTAVFAVLGWLVRSQLSNNRFNTTAINNLGTQIAVLTQRGLASDEQDTLNTKARDELIDLKIATGELNVRMGHIEQRVLTH